MDPLASASPAKPPRTSARTGCLAMLIVFGGGGTCLAVLEKHREAVRVEHAPAPSPSVTPSRPATALDKKQAREAEKAAALERTCGPKPVSLDERSPMAIDLWLSHNTKNPGSVEIVACTDPVLTDACWVSACDYRARNGFGALVVERRRFTIGANPEHPDEGRVVSAKEVR